MHLIYAIKHLLRSELAARSTTNSDLGRTYSLLRLLVVQRNFWKCGRAALSKISLGFNSARSAVYNRNVGL